ncbi:hypothetical protein NADFUDRAFT_82582 [Nadsonia fulvescens var. elongata DSM 6958]|uniref:Zn(2)-C6 fungal-type domain-containing protein n=1 Tax=Nadsonia fulvescens var. elongata DSM 6958 TaxID=857566 RepID=A0A1E3PJL6_9ASCO|nr:hypothetical protein NADFUDRAFT_82582 [Nadsonia fulvescens var. elongata DSM 6958]
MDSDLDSFHSRVHPKHPNHPPLSYTNETKKRRVTRACDECRKKKVKCDGQQPCIHCTVYSYDCTYDRPSVRRRLVPSGTPQLLVESKLLKLSQVVLDALVPGLDLSSETFDIQQFLTTVERCKKDGSLKIPRRLLGGKPFEDGEVHEVNPQTHKIDNNNFNDDFTTSKALLGPTVKIILPPKHVASELIESVWENACVLFRFYHRPTFIKDLDLLYETDPDDYTDKQNKTLPLVYSVMAVGVLFSMDKCERLGFKDASEGYKYFVAARQLIDIADARDTYAIQSILMMIIFLQCSARLSTCYSYIGVALRSALRAGLHRRVTHAFNPIELETRKRLFWTIRKMDVYVNAMLGLPRSISEDDFDQDMPVDLDDENITESGYFPQRPTGKISSAGIANAHTRLITIMSHIIRDVYPIKVDDKVVTTQEASHALLFDVTHKKVTQMENEIRDWLDQLPEELKPNANPPLEYLKANRLLHLAFCHIQIVLYRPFIHYCAPSVSNPTATAPHDKARACARSCINVARTVMYIADDLVSRKMLNGAYWFSIYTIFFSVACLVYYVHENPHCPLSPGIRADAELGRSVLMSLRGASMAATRTYTLLNSLFDQLNKRTREAERETSNSDRGPGVHNLFKTSNHSRTNVNYDDESNNKNNKLNSEVNQNDTNSKSIDNSSNNNLSNNNNHPKTELGPPPSKNANSTFTNTNKFIVTRVEQTDFEDLSRTPFVKLPQGANASVPATVAQSIGTIHPNALNSQFNFENFGSIPSETNNKNKNNNYERINSNNGSNFPAGLNQNTEVFDDTLLNNLGFVTGGLKNSSDQSITTTTNNNEPISGIPPSAPSSSHYIPGMMDQVDTQLFGRFLPPYMLDGAQTASHTTDTEAPEALFNISGIDIGRATATTTANLPPDGHISSSTATPASTKPLEVDEEFFFSPENGQRSGIENAEDDSSWGSLPQLSGLPNFMN